MLTIEMIIELQKKFDECHSGNFKWSEKITDNNIHILEHIMLSMVGEFGEAANLVKKVIRGDNGIEDIRAELTEEVIDIFIYVIKLIYQLDIDLEKSYIQKMEKNQIRFKSYFNSNA